MPFAPIAAGNIHYRFDGPDDAPVLVMSNSLGTNLSLWDKQVAALSRSFRVLRYDSRGHGNSTVPPGPCRIDDMGRDVVGLLDQLAIPRVHFCGLSMGGMVGMWLASHAPTRIDRLVLANTSAFTESPETWDRRIEKVQKGGMAVIADEVIARWFTPAFREHAFADVEPVRAMLLTAPTAGYSACCAAIRDMDQRASLPTIQAPTLVIAGTHDPSTPPAMGRGIAVAIPDARYVELSAAHLSNIEAADAFNDAVADFLLA